MRTVDELVGRLADHAGLPRPDGKVPTDPLAESLLSKAPDRRAAITDLADDIVACLHRLNPLINGHFDQVDRRREIPDRLVYAIASMMDMCLEKAVQEGGGSRDVGDLLRAAWKISCAWSLLVAGDIDDLQRSVSLEASERGLQGADGGES